MHIFEKKNSGFFKKYLSDDKAGGKFVNKNALKREKTRVWGHFFQWGIIWHILKLLGAYFRADHLATLLAPAASKFRVSQKKEEEEKQEA